MTQRSQGIELFFSYSSADRTLRDELERHLAVLKRQGVITSWHDRQITAGSDWAGAIDAHLDTAGIILLLVSADFLHSDYCYDVEMKRALQRHTAGDARVIPVLLRAVEWQGAPFSHLQAVPSGGVAVTSWTNRDEAFADVARAITRAVAELRSSVSAAHAKETPRRVGVVAEEYFPEQRQLIEGHARSIVGRHYVDEAIDRFVTTHSRGYFIIEGGPGLGKSAIAARLVATRGLAHHFIGRTGRRSDLGLVLASLLRQLGGASDPSALRTTAFEGLTALFEAALRQRAESSPPCVLVIDALNELSGHEHDEFPFLPAESLPVGAYFVVTTQPGRHLERLIEWAAAIPTQVYELGPLLPEEVRQFITARQPAAPAPLMERVGRASFGNPLYLRATLDSLALGLDFDADTLPEAVEGYFRRATRGLGGNPMLRDVLGLLAVSRKGLSLLELSDITGAAQRSIHEQAIEPIRPFLRETDSGFAFYHERFHDFALRELLFGDELRMYHARIADWLLKAGAAQEYYWTSLTYHLHESGDTRRVLEHVDEQFLAGKLRHSGYAVLEDLELLAQALLGTGDAGFVEACVARLDGLRDIVGSEMVDELARSVQPHRPAASSARGGMIEPRLGDLRGIDAYAVLLPKREVSADFVEVVRRDASAVVAIGDAPLSGLKSAFVARFVATLFRSLALSARPLDVGQILGRMSEAVSRHQYFERVSMQCVEVRPEEGTISIVSAGHPYPVLYSPHYGRGDRLPVRGPLLQSPQSRPAELPPYQVRHAEITTGSVIVMVSDGITDAGPIENPYGYRFISVIERHARGSAQTIATAILQDWRSYITNQPHMDDATILVLVVADRTSAESHHANHS